MSTDPISTIVAKNLCTGCGACAGVFPSAIQMFEDPVNGRRPVVENSIRGKRAAEAAVAVCGGATGDWSDLQCQDDIDADWGPVSSVWQGWAADPEVRQSGSSGGAVTALALFALETAQADGVAHIAARPDDPRLNQAVISRDRAGLMRGTGSRYAQASPAEAIKEIAAGTDRVVFVGKPCDVASVKRVSQTQPSLGDQIPLTISIFCAGAPNLQATDRLLDRLEVPKQARLVDLRYRGNGWPGRMQATWVGEDGTEQTSEGISYAEGWGKILQSERRWRCRMCADHTGALADISVGDPWHTPPADQSEAGQSLIVARTEKGQKLIQDAIRTGVLIATPQSRDVIERAQPNLKNNHGAVWGRTLAMRAVGLPAPKTKGQRLFELWLGLSTKQKVQSVLGTWKRILRERLWRKVSISEVAK
ncbi:coenzyme F420-reducing hydrogenase subunit beta [Falsiruegeria litorea R37]|uniref:Coenzyme F420-reducing hydrogenase subunit beta n=1 Tax=Falsiruegeria litorea R37 TaxID=1200284 RepID=A0A1Y5TSU1_9RHOB|nr:Coenzyme F420 hydrogenase/dehydrogenase, beta subunit C-terminal domain [Falsiruegeria litorea]SLN67445.1 coenzyme F420-reducing hydrogenase subunit beta [Falsiruegeria litorea R37]